MSTLSTTINLSGIRNPISFKPTLSIKIRTYSPTPAIVNQISSGLVVTADNALPLTTFTITPVSSIVNSYSKNSITAVHVIPHSANDYMLLTFDASMDISPVQICTVISGITTIACVRETGNRLRVTYSTAPSSNTVSFDVENIRNYDVADVALTFTAVWYTS
jgi:hypothetical protein